MTFHSVHTLEIQRDSAYLVECLNLKRDILGRHAADLDHAISKVLKLNAAIEAEFQAYIRECLEADEPERATAAVEEWMEGEIEAACCEARR